MYHYVLIEKVYNELFLCVWTRSGLVWCQESPVGMSVDVLRWTQINFIWSTTLVLLRSHQSLKVFWFFLNRDFHSSVNNILAFKPRKISFEVEKIPEVEFFDRKSLFPKGNYSPVAFIKRPKMDGCAKRMVICRQVDGQRNILLSQKYHERPSSFRI